MKDLDDLGRPLLVLAGVFGGVWIYSSGYPGIVVMGLIAVVAGSARIQAGIEFPHDPVAARCRMELWPLIQIPAGAVITIGLLLVATSDVAARMFGSTQPAATQKELSTAIAAAIGLAVTGVCSYFLGDKNAKLGARYAFERAIRKLRFRNGSRGYEAQYLPSIEGVGGTVGWGFEDRGIRAAIAKEELQERSA